MRERRHPGRVSTLPRINVVIGTSAGLTARLEEQQCDEDLAAISRHVNCWYTYAHSHFMEDGKTKPETTSIGATCLVQATPMVI